MCRYSALKFPLTAIILSIGYGSGRFDPARWALLLCRAGASVQPDIQGLSLREFDLFRGGVYDQDENVALRDWSLFERVF